jgi:metal-responsive CopG/Arc/MetJ family transcriptional regulator
MDKSAKVAISLPASVLKAIEKERLSRGESRSEFFRRAVEILLKQEKEAKLAESYMKAYRASPESTEEVEAAHRIAGSTLVKEPW